MPSGTRTIPEPLAPIFHRLKILSPEDNVRLNLIAHNEKIKKL